MKNQFKLLTLAATAAMMFTACSSDKLETYAGQPDLNPEAPSNAIQFGTYMGKSTTTRAGVEGDIINNDVLKGTTLTNASATVPGFGVFAVYTGGTAYNDMNARTANFMYNEKIYWDSNAWKYAILKYWPNEIASGNVDTQSPTAAQGAAANGNVSFFAYAPWVGTADGAYGITSMSANDATRNPWIGYTLDKAHFVDLLWGSNGETSANVLGTAQNGGGAVTTDWNGSAMETGLSYSGNVNVDLTKQKVNGQVKFSFKHALARLGGPAVTADRNASGFRVKLDIDNSVNGEVPASPAITGGTRQYFTVSSANDAWRTKVTIKNIEITNDLNNDGDYDDGTDGPLKTTGILDLARGYWYNQANDAVITKRIGTTVTAPVAYAADEALNTKLAETYSDDGTEKTWISKADYSTKSNYFLTTEDTNHPGVTEEFQNVYNSASAHPLTLIPGTTPKFKVTITYVVRTYDDKLSTKYTEVTQTISKVIEFTSAVEVNKRYNIDMHLGLTSVKFEASVADWATEGTVDTDSDGHNDSTPVHLPINVM